MLAGLRLREGDVGHQVPANLRDGEPHYVGSRLHVVADAVEVGGRDLVSRRATEEKADLRADHDHVQDEGAVLVVIVEVPEDAQRVGAEAGTLVVRLQLVDERSLGGADWDLADSVFVPLPLLLRHGLVVRDWKLGVRVQRSAVLQDENCRDVVQGRPELVQRFASQHADRERYSARLVEAAELVFLRRIEVRDEAVGGLVEELLDRLAQFADVAVRALQLLVYAVERVGHAPAAPV